MTKGIKAVVLPNVGILDKKLSDQEMDYLWKCIDSKKEDFRSKLAGNISGSYRIMDRGNWFFNNTIRELTDAYYDNFTNLGSLAPINQSHPYYMREMWVNYQKQGEFNPLHNHTGVYSFVIWMKIPTDYDQQRKLPFAKGSNSGTISNFEFSYTNILGMQCSSRVKMSPEKEGTMMFFPSDLRHQVYPFYDCDEERISISGNILLNTAKKL
tara:strand:+ start:579 stop:1211 length:633 start_codon:yes stop_codon:yes gene_type:complete